MSNVISPIKQLRQVRVGENFSKMLKNLSFLDEEELKTLRDESIDIISRCTHEENSNSFQTGLVVGYVQSGKTLSFTTVSALAADNNYSIIIVLAGTKTNLLSQTTQRLRKDLLNLNSRKFKIIENLDLEQKGFIARRLSSSRNKVSVLTVLKHSGRIKKLTQVFEDEEVKKALSNKPVLIIDDEADQASLNTKARYNFKNDTDEESSTFVAIHRLRSAIINHTFLQYTATPQGPLLIDIISSLSPEFYCVISPGKNYTGGMHFFGNDCSNNSIKIIPSTEVYHHSDNTLSGGPPASFREAMIDFFISSTIILDHLDIDEILGDDPILSMMIHPTNRIDGISLFYTWSRAFVDSWITILELNVNDPSYLELVSEINSRLNSFNKEIDDEISFEHLKEDLYERLLEVKIHKVTGADLEVDWTLSSTHILVGGGKLDRGYTVKGLLTTYMPRNTKGRSNADTIQQRCRFFGYKKKYKEFCRIYLPTESQYEYQEYVKHEEYLREILKNTEPIDFTRKFLLDDRLMPTRSSILSSSMNKINLKNAKQTSAINHLEWNKLSVAETYNKLEFSPSPFNKSHSVAKVKILDAVEFLMRFKMTFSEDTNLKSVIIESLLYLKIEAQAEYCLLYNMSSGETRERKADNQGKIDQLFSGASSKYVGDRYMINDSMLSIQVHTVKLNSSNPNVNNKIIKTLGFVFPNQQITFQGTMS